MIRGLAFLAAIVGLGYGAAAGAEPRSHMIALINDIDNSFVCPETLSSDADRSAALAVFAKRLAANNVSYAQATRILDLMLRRHECAASVAEPVADSGPAPLPAPVITVASAAPQN